MPECHKCKWDAEPPSDAKRAACLDCVKKTDYRNLSSHGQCFVSLDAAVGNAQQSAADVAAATERFKRESEEPEHTILNPEDPIVAEAMKLGAMRVLQFLKNFDPGERDTLLMATFSTLSEYAKTINKTRACTSKWWREIVAKWPELNGVVLSNINNPKSRAHGRARK